MYFYTSPRERSSGGCIGNWPSGSREEDFKNSSMYFCYFVIISHWKRAITFLWTNLNPLHSRMLYDKFGWNWPGGSWEEDKNVKSLRWQQRWTTDKFWSKKLTWAFSSGEPIGWDMICHIGTKIIDLKARNGIKALG